MGHRRVEMLTPIFPRAMRFPAILLAVAVLVGCGGGTSESNTQPGDTTPPALSATAAVPAMNGATVTWTTDEAADSQVDYGTTTSYGSSSTLAAAMVMAHSVDLAGLSAATVYHYRVKSRDGAGNLATGADLSFTTTGGADTTPPVLSVIAAVPAATTATITWTSNEPADTQVEFGTTTAYGSSSTLATNLIMSHTVNLSSLTAATGYHYRVKSRDAAGNLATSADQTFTTLAAPDMTAPTVSITAPAANAAVSGTISVTANASDNVGVVGVQFRLDGAALGSEDTTSPYSSSWNTTSATNAAHALTAVARDAAGNTRTSASVTVTVSNGSSGALFPLHTDPTKHYLIDASGNPFLVNGDTPWDLTARLTDAEIVTYLNDRQAKGINTLLVELMDHTSWPSQNNPHAPNNVAGDPPFTTADDFSTPNEAYMVHVAAMLQAALDRDILVMMTPAYVGFAGGDQGWWVEMQANGTTKLTNFGKYLANRFAAYPNIVWVQGGDFSPSDHSPIDAIANGIRSVNTTWLQTFHGGRGTDGLDWTTASWLTLNSIYTDGSTSQIVSHANAQYANTMPFFLIESAYEAGSGGDGGLIRPQLYAAALSGANGYLLGFEDLWPFPSGWQTNLNSGGATAMRYFGQLWRSRSWWLLVPSGTGRTAYASGGSFGFAYASGGSVVVDLSKLAGPQVRAQWYDPTSGALSAVTGSPFANTGTPTLSHPGSNSSGGSDWVVVLDSQ
jgi:hypothetical protein